MNKFLSIFLAFQILATHSPTNLEILNIFKMGEFCHHFIHHITCLEEKIDIVAFVKMHYPDHPHFETDYCGHKNLPFQHNHPEQQNLASQIPCLLPPAQTIVAFPGMDIVSNPLIAQSQEWHSSPHLGDIWQPPKA